MIRDQNAKTLRSLIQTLNNGSLESPPGVSLTMSRNLHRLGYLETNEQKTKFRITPAGVDALVEHDFKLLHKNNRIILNRVVRQHESDAPQIQSIYLMPGSANRLLLAGVIEESEGKKTHTAQRFKTTQSFHNMVAAMESLERPYPVSADALSTLFQKRTLKQAPPAPNG